MPRLQVGAATPHAVAMAQLAAAALSGSAFSVLRGEEGLGYTAAAHATLHGAVVGVGLVATTAEPLPQALDQVRARP